MFNAIMKLCEARGDSYIATHSGNPGLAHAKMEGGREIRVLKSHQIGDDRLLRDAVDHDDARVVVASRYAPERLGSLLRVKGEKRSVRLGGIYKEAQRWDSLSKIFSQLRPFLALEQGLIRDNPKASIKALAEFFRMEAPSDLAEQLYPRLRKSSIRKEIQNLATSEGWQGNFQEYDRRTHWHANHIAPVGHRYAIPRLREFKDAIRVAEAARSRFLDLSDSDSGIVLTPSEFSPHQRAYLNSGT